MAEETKMPDEWSQISIHDLVDKGYRLRVKTIKGIQYLSLRKGNSEKGLGSYTPKKGELLLKLFPKLTPKEGELKLMKLFPKLKIPQDTDTDTDTANSSPDNSSPYEPPAFVEALLSTKIGKPKSVKKSFTPTTDTLRWYEWAISHDFQGELDDFVNYIVYDYFKEKGLYITVLKVKGGELNV